MDSNNLEFDFSDMAHRYSFYLIQKHWNEKPTDCKLKFQAKELIEWVRLTYNMNRECAIKIVEESIQKQIFLSDEKDFAEVSNLFFTESNFEGIINKILSSTKEMLAKLEKKRDAIDYWKHRALRLEKSFNILIEHCKHIVPFLPFNVPPPESITSTTLIREDLESKTLHRVARRLTIKSDMGDSRLYESKEENSENENHRKPLTERVKSSGRRNTVNEKEDGYPLKNNISFGSTLERRVKRIKSSVLASGNINSYIENELMTETTAKEGEQTTDLPLSARNRQSIAQITQEERRGALKTSSTKSITMNRNRFRGSENISPNDLQEAGITSVNSNPSLSVISGVTDKLRMVLNSQSESNLIRTEEDREEVVVIPSFTLKQDINNNTSTPPLIIVKKSQKFFKEYDIEPETNSSVTTYKVLYYPDLYKKHIYNYKHVNFLGKDKQLDEWCIVSVAEHSKEGQFEAVKNSKEGFQLFYIPEVKVGVAVPGLKCKRINAIMCEEYLEVIFEAHFQRLLRESSLMKNLMSIEDKHGLIIYKLPIAIVYCKENQTNPLNMFNNRNCSNSWFKFLRDIKISVNEDNTIKIDSEYNDTQNSSNLTSPRNNKKSADEFPTISWHSKKVIFHITSIMDEEQNRRLAGNDNAFVFFKDEGEAFDPSETSLLGNMPQMFLVVQPYGAKYRISSFHRKSCLDCSPAIPKGYLFNPEEILDFILCKLYNGVLTAFTCPPMNRLIQTPRGVAIAEIVDKFLQSKSSKGNLLKLVK